MLDTSSQILPQLSRGGGVDQANFVDNRVNPGDAGNTFFLPIILKQMSYHNTLYALDFSGTGIEHNVAQIGQWDIGALRWDSTLPWKSHLLHGTVG